MLALECWLTLHCHRLIVSTVQTAADAVRRNPEKAVQHGFMRTQTHRSVVYVSRLSDVPATQVSVAQFNT